MEDANFSKKDIQNSHEKTVLEKNTKIVLDHDQLDFIKFRLSFNDGFMFGLGVIIAWIMILIIISMLLAIIGVSFSHILFRGLM
ncbi:MAG: hypothetical protein PHH52_02295 [Patescibacteria group bacterium]|jgi:hypothetical protein|nr:hypothetical protein [Patescibacteria group bacterium]MDD3940658.1 hypothetical protein [Candidatus Paceibacterota bacterium]